MTVSAQRLRLFQGVVLLLWIITVGILTLVLVDINAKNESAFSKQLRFSPLTNSAPINGSFSRGAFVDSTMTVPEEKINEDLLHVPSTSEEPISRSKGVAVTCDVRGNLGPCSVVVQDPPGSDWLKDRWQAASDMGGTAIKGVHWIVLDFGRLVKVHQVILDWETAFARAYRLEGNTAYDATMTHKNKHIREEKQVTGAQIMGDSSTSWDILYDGTTEIEKLGLGLRSCTTSGISPGNTGKSMPLHVVHNITLLHPSAPIRYLRLYILRPAVGWGVSVWEFDVYGRNVLP